jgi:hypothetical protein
MTDLELIGAFDRQVAEAAAKTAKEREYRQAPLSIGEGRPNRSFALGCHPDQAEARNAELKARGITGVQHDPRTGAAVITTFKSGDRVIRDYVEKSLDYV